MISCYYLDNKMFNVYYDWPIEVISLYKKTVRSMDRTVFMREKNFCFYFLLICS